MLNYDCLDDNQVALINRLYDFDETFVYATMGSGKSVCYLTAINELLRDKVLKKVLIIAPLNPCRYVWSTEHEKWTHLSHLRVGCAVGTPKQRKAVVESNCDIVVINIENVAWFVDSYGSNHGFDALCIDELSKFSGVGNKSVKKLRRIVKSFKHRVGLTGTPVHEGFANLYSQMLMLDGGRRLGTSKQRFLDKYFMPLDYNRYNWGLRPEKESDLVNAIKGVVHAMPEYPLPDLTENYITVELPVNVMDTYKAFKRSMMIECDGVEIYAENEAVLSGKLEQFANGFLYDEDQHAHFIHREKQDALEQFLTDWDGKPLLIFYQYEHDKSVISEMLQDLGIDYGTMDAKDGVKSFLAGRYNVLLLHPKSAGHGLNLHTGGAAQILCYCPIWSNDQFKQLVGRLRRRGQKQTVTVTSIVCKDTVDEMKLVRVSDKDAFDSLFKKHVKG